MNKSNRTPEVVRYQLVLATNQSHEVTHDIMITHSLWHSTDYLTATRGLITPEFTSDLQFKWCAVGPDKRESSEKNKHLNH